MVPSINRPRFVRGMAQSTGAHSTDEVFASNDSIALIDQNDSAKLVRAQRSDPELNRMIEYLEKKATPATATTDEVNRLIADSNNFLMVAQRNGVPSALFYMPARPKRGLSSLVPLLPRLVVPRAYRESLITMFHDSAFGGHFGIKRTLRKVCVNYYWPQMHKDVNTHVAACVVCNKEKVRRRTAPTATGFIEPPSQPFELISLDFVGPMEPKSEDFRYILVVIDHFSRWAITIPTQSMEAEVVAQALPMKSIIDTEYRSEF